MKKRKTNVTVNLLLYEESVEETADRFMRRIFPGLYGWR